MDHLSIPLNTETETYLILVSFLGPIIFLTTGI